MKRILISLALSVATTTASQAAKLTPYVDAGGKRVIALTGEIYKGDSERLRVAIQRHKATDVTLSSIGGLLSEGIYLSRVMESTGVAAHVLKGDQCLSACALAFIGAKNQSLNGGILAFHNGGLIDAHKKGKQQISSDAQRVGMWYYRAILAAGYHAGLAQVILTHTGATNSNRWLVFRQKRALDRWYIGPPVSTPMARFTEGWPVTESEINQRLKRLR